MRHHTTTLPAFLNLNGIKSGSSEKIYLSISCNISTWSDYEEYDDEYDLEDDLDDDYGFGLLDDDYDDEEILPDAQDINGDILKEINDNVSFFLFFFIY